MCKLHGYRYRCGHQNSHRLSRCRVKFSKDSLIGHGKVPACLSIPYLEVVSPSLCGPCQYSKFTKEWTNRIRLAENALNVALYQWEPSSWTKSGEPPPPDHKVGGGEAEVDRFRKELEKINADYESRNWSVRRLFPTHFRPVYPRLQICTKEKKPSRLRNEVRPEDVVLFSGRKSRSPKEQEHRTFQSFFRGRYSATGPQLPEFDLGYGNTDAEENATVITADSGWQSDYPEGSENPIDTTYDTFGDYNGAETYNRCQANLPEDSDTQMSDQADLDGILVEDYQYPVQSEKKMATESADITVELSHSLQSPSHRAVLAHGLLSSHTGPPAAPGTVQKFPQQTLWALGPDAHLR